MTETLNEICPVCNCQSYSVIPAKVNHTFYLLPREVRKCDVCGLVFLSSFDHLNEKLYQKEYMKDYYGVLEVKRLDEMSDYEKDLLRHRYDEIIEKEQADNKRRYKDLKKYIGNKHLIDFGCGSGSFGLFFKDTDFVEQSEFFNLRYQDLSIPVCKCIRSVFYPADVITMFHVIEHLEKPKQVLREIRDKLNKNGLLIIETPNSNDVLIEKNQPFRDFSFRSDHVILYNRQNIILLLNEVGFKKVTVKYIQRYNASNHVQWYKDGQPDGHLNKDEWSGDDLNNAYTKALIELEKTDTMLIIAK